MYNINQRVEKTALIYLIAGKVNFYEQIYVE